MSEHPNDRKYSPTHEWLRVDGKVGVIGISEHAQQALGDVVFVELPVEGATLTRQQPFGTIESVKAVSELFAPASGRVVAVNAALQDRPELVNQQPHDEGWLLRIELSEPDQVADLLDAAAYAATLEH